MTSILIQSANVLDVETLKMLPDTDVWVRDGQIETVGQGLPVPEGAQIVSAKGLTLMPGLIDCHVHVIASHLNLTYNSQQPNVFATLRAIPIMKGMLMRGFTTCLLYTSDAADE